MDNMCIYQNEDKRCTKFENNEGINYLCNGLPPTRDIKCEFYLAPEKIEIKEEESDDIDGVESIHSDDMDAFIYPAQNQDCKSDEGKYQPTLVSPELIKQVARVREYGVKKYNNDEHNWRKVGPRRYLDAAFRHLLAYQSGEENDPESGLNHLAHVACNIQFLLEFEKDK